MPLRPQMNERGIITQYRDTETNQVISVQEFQRRLMMQQSGYTQMGGQLPQMHQGMPMQQPGMMPMNTGMPMGTESTQLGAAPVPYGASPTPYGANIGGGYGNSPTPYSQTLPPAVMNSPQMMPPPPSQYQQGSPAIAPPMPSAPGTLPPLQSGNPLMQPGAQMLGANGQPLDGSAPVVPGSQVPGAGAPPTAGEPMQGKTLRMEGVKGHNNTSSVGYRTHGFLDATSIAILLPTLVLLALIIAAAHKKRLFPWQTIRTFNPPSGLMSPRDYERSFVCPPNLRRHGRLGKRDPQATWNEQDGIVVPFGFLARTHLPITIPMGRLPNKNMFLVAPSGSGKTTLMRAIIKALLAKPCVIVALEAKANDPHLDERREGFKYALLPEAQQAGFDCLYFNPLDSESIHWNPLDLDAITFASSIVQDINSLDAEEQHWAERDHGYICGLTMLLKWGAVMVSGEDENGQAQDVQPLPCNPRGLMRLVNNRRNIVESLRRLKTNPNVPASELSELTQTLSSIIRTDTDWDKNIQGVRGRLRMFKNPNVLRCTEQSNVDIRQAMHRPTVLIFGAPASLGPDAESLASCFVYQLQQALHTRYGTKSVLPLFAFFDEYQTLNMDIAGRLSAIVRGANGGLAIILQNISQIAKISGSGGGDSELRTIFSNSAIRVCLHNADETTAAFFAEEIGKHAIIVPGVSDHYDSNGFGIFPTSWNRIHSQQVVARVDSDSIKRMEKHHALVYLSPAGDQEFGETKPFMCDLRGIEEIARLHLLHNVTGRNPIDDGSGSGGLGNGNGGQPSAMPGSPAPQPGGVMGIPAVARIASNPILASMMGKTPDLDPKTGAPITGAPVSSVPIGGGGVPSNPIGGGGVQSSDRACAKCGKYPGKGRFCIECGTFVGQNAAVAQPAAGAQPLPGNGATTGGIAPTAPAPVYQPAPTPVGAGVAAEPPEFYQPSNGPAGRPPFPGSQTQPAQVSQELPAIQPQQRPPVTSLHPDLSKFGIQRPQVGPQAENGQRQPGRPQQKTGIEF